MKILLLGEFSALHKNLKDGLVELGHETVVAAYGDGYKKVPNDSSFDSEFTGILCKIHRRTLLFNSLCKLKNFDIVQLMNPFLFNISYFPTIFFYQQLIKQNEKFFMLGAGSDAYFWKNGRQELAYGPFDSFLKYDRQSENYFMSTHEAYQFNKVIVEKVRGVIPIMYEYEVSYKNEKKRLNTIPIPININKIQYDDNRVGQKLVIFHGLSRYGFKGTPIVEEAFKYLSKKYPNDLDLIIDGKMPLSEYLDVMKRTNVVIDQMYSHSLGVNGVYALAMGKVVMGGAEPESLKSLGVNTSPVINLKPNAKSIIDEVEKLLKNRNQIQELGFKSRQFAEQVHGHVKVAQQYIDTWMNN
jgi:glycosyltransferase involved in cell wall biosynthesis